MGTLDEVLLGDDLDVGKIEEPAEEEPKGEVEESEEDSGEREEKGAEPPAAKDTKDVPLPALLDERDKRKRYQERAEQLERELTQLKSKPQIDPIDDLEGAINQRVEQSIATVNARFVDLTESLAKSKYEDYDAMRDRFINEANNNRSLYQQMLSDPNPAEFAYRHAKRQFELEQAGDLDTLKSKIRKEVEAELLADLNGKRKVRDSVPDTLSDARASGGGRDKPESGPTPLGSIFGGS